MPYLWRPISGGLCTLRELQDGTYSIDDLADFHEFLDLREALAEFDRPKGD